MNDCQKLYIRWLNQPGLENLILQELLDIKGDKSSITDRFCRELEFGDPRRLTRYLRRRHQSNQPLYNPQGHARPGQLSECHYPS